MLSLKLTPVFLDIETTGLSPLEHEIVAVGLRTIQLTRKSQYEPWDWVRKAETQIYTRETLSEEALLEAALNALTRSDACIIGYNIIGFDIPFITARALFNKFPIPVLRRLRGQYRIDLMHVVTRYLLTNNRHAKLKDIAAFLDLSHDNDVSGADIPKLFEEKNFEAIKQHCQKDVETIYGLFLKLRDLCIHNLQRRYNLDCEVVFEKEG